MLMRGAVLVAGVASIGAQTFFVPPACDGADVTRPTVDPADGSDFFPGDNAVPAYRADAGSCTSLGDCTVGTEVTENLLEASCTAASGTHVPYTVNTLGSLATDFTQDKEKSVPPGWTGASQFPEDASGKSCWTLEGPPKQPTYKLPMCKMYNENACCAPIHDAETQWAYETLVNVADRCAPKPFVAACSSG